MRASDLKVQMEAAHKMGKRVAVSFCTMVPEEILQAAGFHSIRINHLEDFGDEYPKDLPKNLCPAARECYEIANSDILKEADLIITESSCDGKKKMYELLADQTRNYYYQVPQGNDREYSLPLIVSEIKFLIQALKERFGVEIRFADLLNACQSVNQMNAMLEEIMDLQKGDVPAFSGKELYQILLEARRFVDEEEKLKYLGTILQREKEKLENLGKTLQCEGRSLVSEDSPRILITGSPISGIYENVLTALEENGGQVVCFENCEGKKGTNCQVNLDVLSLEELIEEIARKYLHVTCAIMSPNVHRMGLLKQLIKEFRIHAVVEFDLHACNSYMIESDHIKGLCKELDLPYLNLEVKYGDKNDSGIGLRLSAMLEMIN